MRPSPPIPPGPLRPAASSCPFAGICRYRSLINQSPSRMFSTMPLPPGPLRPASISCLTANMCAGICRSLMNFLPAFSIFTYAPPLWSPAASCKYLSICRNMPVLVAHQSIFFQYGAFSTTLLTWFPAASFNFLSNCQYVCRYLSLTNHSPSSM